MATGTDIVINDKIDFDIKEPRLWKVLLLNDDKTPMDFVIDLLKDVFKHQEETAKTITLDIHNTGSGVAGVYSYEIAEHKGVEVKTIASSQGFPLQVKLEEE